jgi:hypothetical protein
VARSRTGSQPAGAGRDHQARVTSDSFLGVSLVVRVISGLLHHLNNSKSLLLSCLHLPIWPNIEEGKR